MAAFDSSFPKYLAGVDEAGRGPLAGDVFAAAVVLKPGVLIDGINDSKKLSAKRREILFDQVIQNCDSYHIARVDADTIDEINILNATFLAMRRALDGLSSAPHFALIDGNQIRGVDLPYKLVIGGDSKSQSIAAASILAKVSRDRYITELDSLYPQYGFAKHKGYGTKAHMEALANYGLCPIHRRSFCKKFLGDPLC